MNRRDFLKTTAALAALGVVTKFAGTLKAEAPAKKAAASGEPDMVAVKGGEPGQMFDMAIQELGGMKNFVKKGQTVVIKPNIAWDQPPEMAANTNPELIARIVERCKEAGASKIYVFDTTCNSWKSTYKNSGIAEAAEKAGAIVVGGDSARDKVYLEKNYTEVDVPGAERLKKMKLHNLVKDCDVFINVPVLKVHGGAQLTCCMKNLMGMVSKADHRYFHNNNLHQCIAECCSYRKPDLNVVDAYRVMIKHGPRGVNRDDVKVLKYQMVGRDMVALDTAGAKLLDLPIRKVGHLAIGESMGLGTTKLDTLNIKRITI